VTSLLDAASLIIAHNAAFDRGFVDLRVPVSRSKVWACSFRQIDWRAMGYTSQKLEYLAILHGFFMDAHRALADADALAYLLSLAAEASGKPYMLELIENARKTQLHVVAANSPFESKDALRRRGYAWDPAAKAWHKYLYEDDWDAEKVWLESGAVYNGPFKGRCHALALTDNFKQGTGA
jgi:DNA polymerase-3 subunit epsilon